MLILYETTLRRSCSKSRTGPGAGGGVAVSVPVAGRWSSVGTSLTLRGRRSTQWSMTHRSRHPSGREAGHRSIPLQRRLKRLRKQPQAPQQRRRHLLQQGHRPRRAYASGASIPPGYYTLYVDTSVGTLSRCLYLYDPCCGCCWGWSSCGWSRCGSGSQSTITSCGCRTSLVWVEEETPCCHLFFRWPCGSSCP